MIGREIFQNEFRNKNWNFKFSCQREKQIVEREFKSEMAMNLNVCLDCALKMDLKIFIALVKRHSVHSVKK